MKIIFFVFFVLPWTQISPAQEQKVYTVCEVLANLKTLKDQIVAVRGRYVANDEWEVLQASKCAQPLVTNGFVWPTSISLTYPRSPHVEGPKFDAPAVSAQMSEKLAYGSQASVEVVATYVGRLETRSVLSVAVVAEGRTVGIGYGHLGATAAQLVYKEVRDVRMNKLGQIELSPEIKAPAK